MGETYLLVGNPNAGKSTLFNALARGHARVGNWHGVTVGLLEGRGKRGALRGDVVCDLPGIYSMKTFSMEEAFTRDVLRARPEARLLFVAEYASLPRALPLFLGLLSEGRQGVLLLTKRRAFLRAGGNLDIPALAERLGVPVLSADGTRGRELAHEIAASFPVSPRGAKGDPLADIYTPQREGLSRVEKFLSCGWVAAPLFALFLAAVFFLTFARGMPGDWMKCGVQALFTDTLAPLFGGLPPVARSFFQVGLCGGLGSVLCFLPQIALLFFFLSVLEESGLLSRLAVLTDGFFSALGLNGRAVFSLVMGFGCTAAAVLTTRGLEDKAVQRRAVLCLPYIPCSAKLPVFVTLSASFFSHPFVAAVLLYALGAGISVCVALLFKRGASPLVLELAPLRVPRPLFLLKSLYFQIKQFIIKVATALLAFFLLSWLLSSFDFSFRLVSAENSMLAGVCGWMWWLFAPAGMPDWRIAYAALSGLVAKENIAGALAMFYGGFPYGAESAFAFAMFVLTCSPCISAVTATAKELGWKRAALYSAAQTGSALLLCYFTYFCLRVYYLALPLCALICAGLGLLSRLRYHHEKLPGNEGGHPQKLHRRHRRTGVVCLPRAVAGAGYPRKRRAHGGGRPAPGGRRSRLLHDARAGEQEGVFRDLRG